MSEEGRLQVPGGRIWYKMIGDGGVPIVVLHGGPGGTHEYLENLEALADGHRLVFYDQLGGGRSDRPDDPSLWTSERFVEELDVMLSHIDSPKVHLLGQSWGTALAVMYARDKGQGRIASMVLSGPYLSTPLWEEDQRRHIGRLPEDVKETIDRCERDGDYASPDYQGAMDVFYRRHVCRMPEWPEPLLRSMGNMGADVYNSMFGPSEFTVVGSLKEMDLTSFLPDVKVPVLYTCGEYDEATPSTTMKYADLTPGSKAIVFPGASHEHHLESERSYLDTVRRFLAKADV